MPGVRIPIISKETYVYSSLGSSASPKPLFIGHKYVDVSTYRECTVLVRVHSISIAPTAQIAIAPVNSSRSDDDPSTFFSNLENPLVVVTLDNSITAPALLSGVLPDNFGPTLGIFLGVQQASTPGVIMVTISVDLSVKE